MPESDCVEQNLPWNQLDEIDNGLKKKSAQWLHYTQFSETCLYYTQFEIFASEGM